MNVNDLKWPVEIWKYNYADNAGGTPIETFKLYRKVYARMQVLSGDTAELDLGKLPYTNVKFTVRYDSTIDYRVQLRYNNMWYEINHIEIIDRMAWMILSCNVNNERVNAEY